MIATIVNRNYLALPLLGAAAAVYGALLTAKPAIAVALIGAAGVAGLVTVFPVASLTFLIFLTAIVPYGLQNAFAGGGTGLLPSDAMLLGGLVVSALLVLNLPLPPRARWALAGFGLFIGIAFLQFVHGILEGRPANDVGGEFRFLLGFSALLVAIPVLADPGRRDRFMKGLLGLALVLGMWGVVQYMGAVPFADAGDAGLRAGVAHTSGGRGQIQGGLFGFPVAVTILFSLLLAGVVKSPWVRALLIGALILNAASLVFTFERTFWVATVLACMFVVAKAGRAEKLRALVWGPVAFFVILALLATLTPGVLDTARERFLSLGQYGTDNSVRYRIVESEHVIERIKAHPVIGDGLAASIFWGRPWEEVQAAEENFVHNAYLWLAWKLGVPAALLFIALIGWVVAIRGPTIGGPLQRAFRDAAQASIMLLMVASVTFPAFNSLSITAVAGVLIASVVLWTQPARSQAFR